MVTWFIHLKKCWHWCIFSVVYKIISNYKRLVITFYILEQTAWWVVNPIIVATLLSPLISHRRVRPQTLWRLRLKDSSIDERFKAWCCVCGWAHQGLTAGFLLLRYSVEYTFESLALFYPLFISRFVCTRRLYNDKLGIFMWTKHLFVLIPVRKKGEFGTVKHVQAHQ